MKGADGKFLWPGYGENARVLEWVFERVSGRGDATESPIGFVPTPSALNTDGLGLSDDVIDHLLEVDPAAWREELPLIEAHFATFGDRLPAPLYDEIEELRRRLG